METMTINSDVFFIEKVSSHLLAALKNELLHPISFLVYIHTVHKPRKEEADTRFLKMEQ